MHAKAGFLVQWRGANGASWLSTTETPRWDRAYAKASDLSCEPLPHNGEPRQVRIVELAVVAQFRNGERVK